MRITLCGTRAECDRAAVALGLVLRVRETSGFCPNRARSVLGRMYVEITPTGAQAGSADDAGPVCFDQVRRAACGVLGDVAASLRMEWCPESGPDARQLRALDRARDAIGLARGALTDAAAAGGVA
jgi:hypothetical protein